MLSSFDYKLVGNALIFSGFIVVALAVGNYQKLTRPLPIGIVVATEQAIFSGDVVSASEVETLLQFSNDTHLVLNALSKVKVEKNRNGEIEATLVEGSVKESSPEIAMVQKTPEVLAPQRRHGTSLAFPGLGPSLEGDLPEEKNK